MNISLEEIEQLSDQAWELIGSEDLEGAMEIGLKLQNHQVETGYRITSMVKAMQEEWEEAINILNEGIKQHPDIWQLHLQLGNFLSDTGKFPEAIRAFIKAGNLPGAEKHWAEINKGIVYYREGNLDMALNTLQEIEHPDAINQAFELQVRILDEIGRNDMIIEMAEEELEFLQTPENQAEAILMASICIYIANAYWIEEQNEPAKHYLRQAIEFDRTNAEGPFLSRSIEPVDSEDSKIFYLTVSGQLDYEGDILPFTCSYGVVADTKEEALEFIRKYEIEAVNKQSLIIQEVEETDNEEDELKGMYHVGVFNFDE
ncbi:MAG: hypothetical protein KDE26_28890 [Bacteroidetes bacterium]|nr:hypothetical protein [Bacteroidota bacterium]MCB0847315.1 hypothetical protein [Bacteroidota bacterium]